MTIKEAENFYREDKKEYILTNKTIINNWIKEIYEKEKLRLKEVKYSENYGYAVKNMLTNINETINDIKKLQELIDFITIWYEIKYSNNFFETFNNVSYNLMKTMTVDELLERLDDEQLDIMLCNYRSGGYSSIPVIINGKTISENSIYMSIDIKKSINGLNQDSYATLNADEKTGLLSLGYTGLEKYINKKYTKKGYITLEELYNELEKTDNGVDYTKIKKIILDKKLREKMRKEILELTALKILYSRNTIPEYGYERAKKIINEMNRKFNINLTTKRIDEIMTKDYKNVKKLVK